MVHLGVYALHVLLSIDIRYVLHLCSSPVFTFQQLTKVEILGKLYTFYSIKWVFLAAIFIFEIGSLLCGVAPNSTALIIGRAVAGLGSAGIFSGAILIIANSVPLRQ